MSGMLLVSETVGEAKIFISEKGGKGGGGEGASISAYDHVCHDLTTTILKAWSSTRMATSHSQ